MTWALFPAADVLPVDSAGRRKPAKFVGRTTRMGVEQYQDYTLWLNDDREGHVGRRLTDEQLCADWQHEFPEAVTFTTHHVQGVRRDFQEGTSLAANQKRSSHGVRDSSGEVCGGAPSRQYR